jgi:hypothetical protein
MELSLCEPHVGKVGFQESALKAFGGGGNLLEEIWSQNLTRKPRIMFIVSEILAYSSLVLPAVVVKICTGSPRNEGGLYYNCRL